MARIRSIKPEFWTSEQVMDCKPVTRLLFIGLWNFADDEGRLPFSPRTIKAQVLPGDDVSPDDVRDMVLELSRIKLVMLYAVEGRDYLQITGWSHQKIDKPQKPKYPAPFADESGPIEDNSPNPPRTLAPDRIGEDRKGEEKNNRTVAKATRPDDQFEEFWKTFPKREGSNPKNPSRKLFQRAVKSGHDPTKIIGGARRYSEECLSLKTEKRMVAQAMTWLRQSRWEDYQTPSEGLPAGFTLTKDTPAQWDAWRSARIEAGQDVSFMDAQRERGGTYTVASEWPSDLSKQEDAA